MRLIRRLLNLFLCFNLYAASLQTVFAQAPTKVVGAQTQNVQGGVIYKNGVDPFAGFDLSAEQRAQPFAGPTPTADPLKGTGYAAGESGIKAYKPSGAYYVSKVMQMLLLLAVVWIASTSLLWCQKTSASMKILYAGALAYVAKEVMAFMKYKGFTDKQLIIEGDATNLSASQKQEIEQIIQNYEEYMDVVKMKKQAQTLLLAAMSLAGAVSLAEWVVVEGIANGCLGSLVACGEEARVACAKSSDGSNPQDVAACAQQPKFKLAEASLMQEFISWKTDKEIPSQVQDVRHKTAEGQRIPLFLNAGWCCLSGGDTASPECNKTLACKKLSFFQDYAYMVCQPQQLAVGASKGQPLQIEDQDLRRDRELIQVQMQKLMAILFNSRDQLPALKVLPQVLGSQFQKSLERPKIAMNLERLKYTQRLETWAFQSLESTQREVDSFFVYQEWRSFLAGGDRSVSLAAYRAYGPLFALKSIPQQYQYAVKNNLGLAIRSKLDIILSPLIGPAHAQTAEQLESLRSGKNKNLSNQEKQTKVREIYERPEGTAKVSVSEAQNGDPLNFLSYIGIGAGLIPVVLALIFDTGVWVDKWIYMPYWRGMAFLAMTAFAGAAYTMTKKNYEELRTQRNKYRDLLARLKALKSESFNFKAPTQGLSENRKELRSAVGNRPPNLQQFDPKELEANGVPCGVKRAPDGTCPKVQANRGLKRLEQDFSGLGVSFNALASDLDRAASEGASGNLGAADLAANRVTGQQAAINKALKKLENKINQSEKAAGRDPSNFRKIQDKLLEQLNRRAQKTLGQKGINPAGLASFVGKFLGDPKITDEEAKQSVEKTGQSLALKSISLKNKRFKLKNPYEDDLIEETTDINASDIQLEALDKGKALDQFEGTQEHQVHKDSSVPIWRIISFRYIKSALPSLWADRRKKIKPRSVESKEKTVPKK